MALVRHCRVFAFGFLVSLVCVTVEQRPSQSGFNRLYVLQPGPGSSGADGGLRVSSISTRHGASGQPHTYDVHLNADFGGQVRNRRMGNQAASARQETGQEKQLNKLLGVNVCGGQCCHGWSESQGSQLCTKPNCIPQCQNGGMCLRPHLCVCKQGSTGKACEQKVPTNPFPALPGNRPTNGHANGYIMELQRPIPLQMPQSGYASASTPANNMAQIKLTVKPPSPIVQPYYIQHRIQQQIGPQTQNQQYIIKPKYYHTHATHTQTHVQSQPEKPIPLAGHSPVHAVGNHTGRIKVIFTPTICKFTCIGSRCHNNCELGNTTTIISENGHATDTLTAPNFRVVVCHLPCMNGGKCSARDKCQCPPNFTGKFCQMPSHNKIQKEAGGYSKTQIHSTQTLPLTFSNGHSEVFNPSIVNIHIKHPPEASLQVHRVSQLDNYYNSGHQVRGSQSGSSSSTSYTYHHTESTQNIQHHGYNIVYPSQQDHVPQYQPVTSKNALGRCFQETAGSQCGKALPGLIKQEQCCAKTGTSWGFHKCLKCPKKQTLPLIDCPQGYTRNNSSHCQDLNECKLQGVCPNGNCLNTVGSYRCMCKAGFIPDPMFTSCISNTPAIPEEKGACFRLVSSGRQCLHPVSAQLSKQLCCCSVGKAWGPRCDKCPPPGTATFKKICPGGMGYTVLPNPPLNKPIIVYQEPPNLLIPRPLPTPDRPVKTFGEPEVIPEVVERSSPPAPVEILQFNAGQDIAPTQSAEVDECQINPHICGQGICYNTAKGYTCHCDQGYHLDDAETTCSDIDECQDQQVCTRGHCRNTKGSFVCQCGPGFRLSATGHQCNDVEECLADPDLCSPNGECLNTEGSYLCVCDSGFIVNLDPPSCEDIDECGLNDTLCGLHGFCENRLGSFQCLCDQGYQELQGGQACGDVNECELLSSVCGEAECVNLDGSFMCVCPTGQDYDVMTAKCVPVPTVSSVERKECYYHLNNKNLCESVLSSHVTLQECCCTLGAGWGDNCEVHPCPVNGTDHFNQMCPSGRGSVSRAEFLYGQLTADSYKDADECMLFSQEVCKGGFCLDTVGSYECYCKTGHDYDPVTLECRDIDECLDDSVCNDGQCMNTVGSYTCFCTHPLVLDFSNNHCVLMTHLSEQHEPEQPNYQGICWQLVTEMTCTQPLGLDRKITYTECCCLFGQAWGMDCALCPPRNTDDYATMCNLPLGGGRRPYSHGTLVASPVHEYEIDPDLPSPELQPALPFHEDEKHEYKAFEGSRAEECGILNGCENGRCVRIQEGYTCDCFDGYTLDLSRMACIDVNECLELNNRMFLCRNAKCINTVGSYQCVCEPGFVVSDKPNYCVEAATGQTSLHTQHQ
ncbi:latent-transforming growth factor beta-binding protein 1 isoform X2 [Betta splendens]|uniref:Latent-transforming growth factor beta-binding protein 1 isoform X2 n=1 Tax=Betta splendens TaxID=158456 RepID=A0A6P7PYQ3_BETSP|nr:latent-transforming growth factor beta-binding protein 1 isoform X2 [Betta splendens]